MRQQNFFTYTVGQRMSHIFRFAYGGVSFFKVFRPKVETTCRYTQADEELAFYFSPLE
jgi:hypothetical protein